MTVGYWRIRGLAQAIRVLCEYCAFEFEARHSPFSPTLACFPFFSALAVRGVPFSLPSLTVR